MPRIWRAPTGLELRAREHRKDRIAMPYLLLTLSLICAYLAVRRRSALHLLNATCCAVAAWLRG